MGLSYYICTYVYSWSYFIFKQMNSDYKIKIGLSCYSHEPVKYKIDKELFEKFRKEFEKRQETNYQKSLSKSPDFINNLLK